MQRRNKEMMLLLALLVTFAGLFFLAINNLRRGIAFFGTGLGQVENYLILVLSFLSVVRIMWSILKH